MSKATAKKSYTKSAKKKIVDPEPTSEDEVISEPENVDDDVDISKLIAKPEPTVDPEPEPELKVKPKAKRPVGRPKKYDIIKQPVGRTEPDVNKDLLTIMAHMQQLTGFVKDIRQEQEGIKKQLTSQVSEKQSKERQDIEKALADARLFMNQFSRH